jgi:hypothetical protein
MLHSLPKNVYSLRLVLTWRHHSPRPRCCEDRATVFADKRANGEEPKDTWRPAPHNRYRDGAPPPGIFWLFAVGELVCDKPCAILAASLVGEW